MKKISDEKIKDIFIGLMSKNIIGMSLSFNINVRASITRYDVEDIQVEKIYIFLEYPETIDNIIDTLKDLTKIDDMVRDTFGEFLTGESMVSKTGNKTTSSTLRYLVDLTEFKDKSVFWKSLEGIEKFNL
jgi:hypothetical protein